MERLDRLGWAVHRTLRVGEARVGIRATSEAFGAWLDTTFANHLTTEESEPHFSVVLPDASGSPGRKLSVLYKGTVTLVRTFAQRTVGRVLLEQLESLRMPERDDAIYLNASFARANGAIGLIPPALVHHLARLRRPLERAGLEISPLLSIGVDPGSGKIVPTRPLLETPLRALDGLAGPGETEGSSPDLFVEAPTDVAVVARLGDVDVPGISRVSRGFALRELASETVNLRTLGGTALHGLGRLVAGARCLSMGGDDSRAVIDALASSLRAVPDIGSA